MKTNKILFGLSALALTALAFSPSLVNAYKGDPNVQGPNYSEDRHEVMEQAFANNDYNTWSQQVQGQGVKNKINETNFAKFSEAHRLSLEGKTQEAAAIRAELGLGLGNGSGQGSRGGNGQGQNAGNCINQ